MKILQTISLASLLFLVSAAVSAQTVTGSKCRADDKDCLKLEKETPEAAAKTSEGFDKKGQVAFRPTGVADPLYRPKPAPTPDDQTAAPAPPPSNGSNPADLITRIEIKYQFQNFAGAYVHAVPIIRGDYAFTKTISVRMDLPILIFDPKTPGQPSETGIGDIVTSMTFVKIFSRRFIAAVVPRIDFPTATHASLGSGKYSFKPTIAGITPLGKGLLFAGVIEYRVSFAGDHNRPDIHEMSIKPIILKSFLSGPMKGYYVNPKAEIIIDFEHNNNATLQAGAEFGRALNKNVVVFVVPTIHVAGVKREVLNSKQDFVTCFANDQVGTKE